MEQLPIQRTDDLTGLTILNVSRPEAQEILRGVAGEGPASFIYADIDNLKSFQDYNGFPVGDKLIIAVANVLRTVAPDRSTVYGVGGDEFLVALPSHSLKQAVSVAEEMRQRISAITLDAYGKWVAQSPGVTLAIASATQPNYGIAQLLRAADEANHRGKHEGKNRVCY